MPDLPTALFLAIGRGALAKHQESCDVCSDEHDCVVAKAHKRSIDRLNRPTPTTYEAAAVAETRQA